MQFLIGLILGIVIYIGAYFIIKAIKRKKNKNKENDNIQKQNKKYRRNIIYKYM